MEVQLEKIVLRCSRFLYDNKYHDYNIKQIINNNLKCCLEQYKKIIESKRYNPDFYYNQIVKVILIQRDHDNINIDLIYKYLCNRMKIQTILNFAAKMDHLYIYETVIDKLKRDKIQKYKWNSLEWAAREGRLNMCKYLIDSDIDMGLLKSSQDAALMNKHKKVATYLYNCYEKYVEYKKVTDGGWWSRKKLVY